MLNRVLTILYIVLCFEVGLLLVFFPWVSPWTANFFVEHYAWISAVAHNYYVRGAISGIGLADLGLGAYEIWRYRRRPRPLAAVPGASTP